MVLLKNNSSSSFSLPYLFLSLSPLRFLLLSLASLWIYPISRLVCSPTGWKWFLINLESENDSSCHTKQSTKDTKWCISYRSPDTWKAFGGVPAQAMTANSHRAGMFFRRHPLRTVPQWAFHREEGNKTFHSTIHQKQALSTDECNVRKYLCTGRHNS